MVAISPHLSLALAWVTATNEMNFTQLAALTPDNFTSYIRPASIGTPPRNKTVFLEQLKGAPIKTFGFKPPAAQDIIETPDVITFYTTTDGNTTHGFPWKSEYILTFTFTGTLIQSVAEFTDPTVIESQFGKEAVITEALFNCPK